MKEKNYGVEVLEENPDLLKKMIKEEKKVSFIKGCVITVVVMGVLNTFVSSSFLTSIIPWHLTSFKLDMSIQDKMQVVNDYLEMYYVDEIDEEMMIEGIYAGMVAGTQDPYTYYLTESSLNTYLESNSGHFVGIGIELTKTIDEEVLIVSASVGNPAYNAGIQSGDIITAVDGVSIDNMELVEITSMIKGEIGKSVTVSIYRENEDLIGEKIDFEIVRDDIVTQTINYKFMSEKIGYIEVTGFKENTYIQFMQGLRNLLSMGAEGFIIDLRNNPGGLVQSVYDISEELLPQGVLVSTIDKDGNKEELVLDDTYFDVPIVVLVNGNSASSSEIFAGAVKDTGRGTVIGTQTYGKGLVQGLYTLPDGSAINITVKKYFTPNGNSIHGTGVTPDIIIEMPSGYISGVTLEEDDIQLQKAFEVLEEEIISE